MSKKRGLSVEEKRDKMLEIFLEKKEFFQLKELEKIGPKEKGVISQSVKEAVQSLVDDGSVESEKIGTFVCYWAFPAKAMQTRKRRLNELEATIAEIDTKCANIEASLAAASESSDDDPEERAKLELQVTALQDEVKKLNTELAKNVKFDPVKLAELKEEAKLAVNSANRWTDNVFSIKAYLKRKFNFDDATINKQFNIDADIDYLDAV